MVWLWLNLALGALFVLAIVGIPLWLVITRPDTGPEPAELAAWRRRSAAVSRDHRHQRAGVQSTRLGRPAAER